MTALCRFYYGSVARSFWFCFWPGAANARPCDKPLYRSRDRQGAVSTTTQPHVQSTTVNVHAKGLIVIPSRVISSLQRRLLHRRPPPFGPSRVSQGNTPATSKPAAPEFDWRFSGRWR